MKKFIRVLTLLVCIVLATTSLIACSAFKDTSINGTLITVTVHYYDNKTQSYTSIGDDYSIETSYLAPSGQYITGLFDADGVQYADYDCIIDLRSHKNVPSDLYARYETFDSYYYVNNPIRLYDEEPHDIYYMYRELSNKISFDTMNNQSSEKLMAACLCNPYADLTINVSFMGKGESSNTLYSRVIIYNEEVASFKQSDLGTGYSQYSYSGKIKAKQLINSDFEFELKTTSGTYGYGGRYYTVKNFKITFSFDFSNTSN